MSLKLLKTEAIPARRLRKPLEILLQIQSFTRKTEGFSLTLAMAILKQHKRHYQISWTDTLHVLLLLNTRLLTLLTRRLLSFLTTWLMIKRKLTLHIPFTVRYARLKWLYGNFIITDIRPSKNTINILLIQLGWIFCRRHLYIYLKKEE